jgi:hypothetical protein
LVDVFKEVFYLRKQMIGNGLLVEKEEDDLGFTTFPIMVTIKSHIIRW